jgi:hypothetical protein
MKHNHGEGRLETQSPTASHSPVDWAARHGLIPVLTSDEEISCLLIQGIVEKQMRILHTNPICWGRNEEPTRLRLSLVRGLLYTSAADL